MLTTIPDLWPTDININVLPPIAILKTQETLLGSRTNGLLQAKLTTTESDQLVQHQLDLIAPSLNFYRERLLSATHSREMLYPVTVASHAFLTIGERIQSAFNGWQGLKEGEPRQRFAATDVEFIGLVGEVLKSSLVKALIHSIIARINGQESALLTNGPIEAGSSPD